MQLKSSPRRYAVIGCKLKQNANEGSNSCAIVVQVLQDLFYVLLHVLFYLSSLLYTCTFGLVRNVHELARRAARVDFADTLGGVVGHE